MALSQKNQQRKKLKKQQKRKQQAKQKKSLEAVPPSLCTIQRCCVSAELWERGIGTVCVIRRSATGRYFFGNYLLDVWGLGLKDAFVREMDPQILSQYLNEQPMEEQTPAYCKALIMAAISYSHQNGLRANLDDKSRNFIENIPFNAEDYQFEFGRDGEPFYISGPYDDELVPRMLSLEKA